MANVERFLKRLWPNTAVSCKRFFLLWMGCRLIFLCVCFARTFTGPVTGQCVHVALGAYSNDSESSDSTLNEIIRTSALESPGLEQSPESDSSDCSEALGVTTERTHRLHFESTPYELISLTRCYFLPIFVVMYTVSLFRVADYLCYGTATKNEHITLPSQAVELSPYNAHAFSSL